MRDLTPGFALAMRIAACLCAGTLLAPGGPPAQAQATASAPETGEAASAAETASAEDENPEPRVAPPDGEWLLDEEGLRYFIETFPKGVEGRDWMWIGEDKIRLWGGLPLDVVAHDEETFSVKIYEIPDAQAPAPPPAPPSEAEMAAVAASYDSGLASRDAVRFVDFGDGLPRRGQWRNGLDVADMNGDGHLDIVFGPHRKGRRAPNVFLGDGRGSWRWWAEANFPDLPYDYGDAAVADFDGDGKPDIALGMHLTGMAVLRGDGAGSFTAWSDGMELADPTKSDAGAFSTRAITVTDWNRDGKPDVLAIGEGMARATVRRDSVRTHDPMSATGILVYVNQGDGTWRSEPVAANVFGDAVAVGDVDGDGRQDVVAATARLGSRRILYLGAGAEGTRTATALESLRPGAWIRTVAVADLDGNGIDDILVGYSNREFGVWRSGIDLFYGSREKGWQRRTLFAQESRQGVYSLATGDLDGDGELDVAAMTGDGEAWVFLGDGDGFFVREESPELPAPIAGCAGYALGLADVDRDGRDEMIVGLAGEPQGFEGLGGVPGCPGEGSLRVWAAEPRPADAVPPGEALPPPGPEGP